MNKLTTLFTHSREYYLKNIITRFPDLELIFKSKRPVVIYGAGRMGRVFLENLIKTGIDVVGFVDSNTELQGKSISGVKIYSLIEARKKFIDNPILIASLMYETEINHILRKNHFTNIYPLVFLNLFYPRLFLSSEYESIFDCLFTQKNQQQLISLYDLLADKRSKEVLFNLVYFRLTLNKKYIENAQETKNMYKDRQILPLTQREIFADCGAFNGDTIKKFIDGVQGKYNVIYGFEPDIKNYKKLVEFVGSLSNHRIMTYQMALYKKPVEVGFDQRGTHDSRLNVLKGNDFVEANSLDFFFKDCISPTFIKMDIESGEIDALYGAKEIIRKDKPKLAISSYHRFDHLWKIPLQIKAYNPDYRIYLRHYSSEIVDTMCIAV